KALELDSTFLAAYVNRAISYANLGNLEKACSDYGKAVELGLNDRQANLEELCRNNR
ncbi:MAG: Flp pilus assembly protein TadD, partial [Cyclobacteriaceae bacterium]